MKYKIGAMSLLVIGLAVGVMSINQKQDSRNMAAPACNESQATKCLAGGYFCGSGINLRGPFKCQTGQCNGNKCKSRICAPGTVKCEGSGARYRCNKNGSGWDIFENCASRKCASDKASCQVAAECSSGQRQCTSGRFRVCNSSGKWGNYQSCPSRVCKDSKQCR